MVWNRGGVQYNGNGAAGSESGGSVQLLQEVVKSQNSVDDC